MENQRWERGKEGSGEERRESERITGSGKREMDGGRDRREVKLGQTEEDWREVRERGQQYRMDRGRKGGLERGASK